MQTVTYKVETEQTATIPDGYELAETTPRVPRAGEFYLDSSGRLALPSRIDGDCCTWINGGKRLILRKLAPPWSWPAWLTAGYIAADADGTWCGYNERPVYANGEWGCGVGYLDLELTTFTAPPHLNAGPLSLLKNPNA